MFNYRLPGACKMETSWVEGPGSVSSCVPDNIFIQDKYL